jgi:hypothetical protein
LDDPEDRLYLFMIISQVELRIAAFQHGFGLRGVQP